MTGLGEGLVKVKLDVTDERHLYVEVAVVVHGVETDGPSVDGVVVLFTHLSGPLGLGAYYNSLLDRTRHA